MAEILQCKRQEAKSLAGQGSGPYMLGACKRDALVGGELSTAKNHPSHEISQEDTTQADVMQVAMHGAQAYVAQADKLPSLGFTSLDMSKRIHEHCCPQPVQTQQMLPCSSQEGPLPKVLVEARPTGRATACPRKSGRRLWRKCLVSDGGGLEACLPDTRGCKSRGPSIKISDCKFGYTCLPGAQGSMEHFPLLCSSLALRALFR
eukprot:1159725-Pelagomonas_calceolata.AAC.8